MKASKVKQDALPFSMLETMFNYDQNTGRFIRMKDGKTVGNQTSNGYRSLNINYRTYLLHRLAWFYAYKKWPPHLVDHVNGNKADNRIVNLREATKSQNGSHRSKPRNFSGKYSVYYQSNTSKWRVKIGNKHIGYYHTLEEAEDAAKEQRKKHYGEFAGHI